MAERLKSQRPRRADIGRIERECGSLQGEGWLEDEKGERDSSAGCDGGEWRSSWLTVLVDVKSQDRNHAAEQERGRARGWRHKEQHHPVDTLCALIAAK